MIPKRKIEQAALSLGFSAIGVTSSAYEPESHERFLCYLSRGYQAGMKYLERGPRERFDPKIHLPAAKSVIVCAHNYFTPPNFDPAKPYISIYARGEDYHRVIKDKLELLVQKIKTIAGGGLFKTYVDSSPASEKSLAVIAGLGFIGRNGLLIIPKKGRSRGRPPGSFHFLGVVISDLQIETDSPVNGTCGKCRRCIDACPTHAILDDGTIDANLCLSYHTTYNKSEIPGEIAVRIGNNIFGCDICQLVCPYNSGAQETSEPRFTPHPLLTTPDTQTLADLTPAELKAKLGHTIPGALNYDLFNRNLTMVENALHQGNGPTITEL